MKKFYNKIKDKIRGKLSLLIMAHLIFLLLLAYLFNNIVYTIYSGEGGVLYRRFFGGTVVDKVYGEGIHLIFPWDKMYIYSVRVRQVAHDFHVLTKNGLKIHLFISIRYFPEYKLLGILHQKVGPQYVENVVIPEIESVLRVLIGRLTAEEVYTTEQAIYEKALTQAIEQVAQRFVNVDNVIIKRIVLPPSVEEAIQNKINQKHIAEAFIFRIEREKREAERKRIEAQGLKDYNIIVSTSLSEQILQWKGIQATLELSQSENSKVVVIGAGKRGLPVLGSLLLDAPENSIFSKNVPYNSQIISESTDAAKTMTDSSNPSDSDKTSQRPENTLSSNHTTSSSATETSDASTQEPEPENRANVPEARAE